MLLGKVQFKPSGFIYRQLFINNTCDALLWVSQTLQCALEKSGQDTRILQISFSAAFDRVNHQEILYVYKLCSVGIGGSMLSILTVSIKSITARYGATLVWEN